MTRQKEYRPHIVGGSGCPSGIRSEVQLKTNLHLASGRGSIRPCHGRSDQAEDRRSYEISIRIGIRPRVRELRVIEDVVALDPKLRVKALRNPDPFSEYEIKIHESRTVKAVATNCSGSHEQRPAIRILAQREGIWVGKPDFVAAGSRWCVGSRSKGIAHWIGTPAQSGTLHVSCAENVERMSSLNGCDSRELHTFENLAEDSIAHVRLASTQGHFPQVADHGHVTDVIVRVAALRGQIARVAREATVAGSWIDWVTCIVDGMGPRIGELRLQPMSHSTGKLRLERVVKRVPDRTVIHRLEQSVMSNSIEG